MNADRAPNALTLEVVKGKDHFVLVYPNTASGRIEAKLAVRSWLLNRQLNFSCQDAERAWDAIDEYWFGGGSFHPAEDQRPSPLRSLVTYLLRKLRQRNHG